MSVMDDMLAWLMATLDEIERVANAASPGPWHANAEGDEVVAEDGITVADGFALSNNQLRNTVAHIALHDPVSALARVASERAILAAIASSTAQYPDYDGGHVGGLEDAAMLIAWGHRHDAPGFLEEWVPRDARATT